LLVQKECSEADLDTEGKHDQVYSELEDSPALSIASDDNPDCTETDGEYHSEAEYNVHMQIMDDVDAQAGRDLHSDVDMERDGDNEEDEEEEDEKAEEVVDEDEERDVDNDKESPTIGQGEMVNTSGDDADTMVDNETTVLQEQGQKMRKYTPRPQPLASAQWPDTPVPPPRVCTRETHSLTGLEFSRLMTLQQPRQELPMLRAADAAGNTSNVDVEQHLLRQSAGRDSLPAVPFQDVPLLDIPLPDVALPEKFPATSAGDE
jgi:hypothetical protein